MIEAEVLQARRKIHLDILRIFACLLVMYNHTSAFQSFKIILPPHNIPLIAISCISKINVPCFFMISGILLIGRPMKLSKIVNRIFRILLILSFCTLFFYILRWATQGIPFSMEEFVHGLFSGKDTPWGVHLWFLYSYLGFLICLPILTLIGDKIDKKLFIWIVTFHLLMATIFPLINIILNWNGKSGLELSLNFEIPLLSSNVFFYPLIGTYLEKNYSITKTKEKNMVCVGGGISLFLIITTVILIEYDGIVSGYGHSLIGLFECIYVISVFLTVKSYLSKIKISDRIHKMLKNISEATFGVYLLDPFLQRICSFVVLKDVNQAVDTSSFLNAMLWIGFSFIICTTIVIFWKWIVGKFDIILLQTLKISKR